MRKAIGPSRKIYNELFRQGGCNVLAACCNSVYRFGKLGQIVRFVVESRLSKFDQFTQL